MRGQLLKTTDGNLICDFPQRMVLIANHQIYTDWLYLWWIGYAAGMHGRIYVVLKESLKRIPVIGWGMQFAQFIFLKRKWEQDKPRLTEHMQRFKNPNEPMWLMMFPEGTNLADSTRELSKQWADKNGIKDMQHTLIPRATGLQFMLQELRSSVDYIYDCTIAYEGVPRGKYAQDIFTVGASYFGGRPPKSVNMYWRRFHINSIPLDDPKEFELWLRSRWLEKDKFIERWYRTGRFPADTGSNKDFKGHIVHGSGYIESEIRPKYWYEFMQVFAPIGLFALVLYMFYGALPQQMVDSLKSIDQKTVIKKIDEIQKGKLKVPETKDLIATAPKDLQDRFEAVKKFAATHDTTPENVIAEAAKKGVDPLTAEQILKRNLSKPAAKASTAKKPLPKTKLPRDPSPKKKLPGNPSPSGLKTTVPAAKKRQQSKSPLKELKQSNIKPAPSQTKFEPKLPAKKPAATTPAAKPTSTTPATSSKAPATKSKPPSTATKPIPTAEASQKQEDENHVDSAEVRKARKKLELRQGKQEPRRKIRRALEAGGKQSEG